MRLILASASPRRRALLARLGIPFEVVPSVVDESLPAAEPASTAAVRLAMAKTRAVAARVHAVGETPAVVLGADTLVVLDARLFGKPASRDDARAMLRTLRGRVHEVVTGLALVQTDPAREATEHVVSRVRMRAYTDAEIDRYVDTGEPDDKAGAYAVQGAGEALVADVEGSYTNVVGLPLETTARLLRAFGLPARDPRP